MNKCRHNHGWMSSEPQTVFMNADEPTSVRLGFNRANRVVVKCNRIDCPARRNAYFDLTTGEFVKFGRVYIQ